MLHSLNREHVKALNMRACVSLCVSVCVGQEGDADSGTSLHPLPDPPALHVTLDRVNAALTHFQQPLPFLQVPHALFFTTTT